MALLSYYLTLLKRCWIGQAIFRPGKCQGLGVFERSTFQIVMTCFLLGTFAPPSVAGETPLSACQGKHEGRVTDKSITRKYDQGVGFNPSQYVVQSYTSSPWPAASIDLMKRREKFETEKLKEFVRTRGAAMLDAPAVVDLVERNGLSAAGRSGDTALRRRCASMRSEAISTAGLGITSTRSNSCFPKALSSSSPTRCAWLWKTL